jgi:hypothetical protein
MNGEWEHSRFECDWSGFAAQVREIAARDHGPFPELWNEAFDEDQG